MIQNSETQTAKFFILNIVFTVAFLILNKAAIAQPILPKMENFTPQDYNANRQNWGIDIDNKGVVYIANNKGLLVYNGQSWQLYELPDKTIVRSVLCYNNMIFTGSYEEFGVWKKNTTGALYYTSLSGPKEKIQKFQNEQFWEITSFNSAIYFMSFARGVYKYTEGKPIEYIKNSFGVTSIATYKNKLIFGNRLEGLQELKDGNLINFELSNTSKVTTKAELVATKKNNLFFYSPQFGGYIYSDGALRNLGDDLNTLLKTAVLNKVVFIDQNCLAFGTLKEGVVLYNLKDNSFKKIIKTYGLENNVVHDLNFNHGNLWAALDTGITKINIDSPLSFYRDITGKLGTVYDILYFKSKYYLASNTGVYVLGTKKELTLIEGTEGQAWDLKVMNNQVIVGHNNGCFIIEGERVLIKTSNNGVFKTVRVPGKNNLYVQGTYYGINKLQFKDGIWNSKPIKNVPLIINNIIFESDSVCWATNPYKGVYRIFFDKHLNKVNKIISFSWIKNLTEYRSYIHALDKNILIYNSGEWLTYYNDKDSIGAFQPFKDFGKQMIVGNDNDGLWFLDERHDNIFHRKKHNLINDYTLTDPGIENTALIDFKKVRAVSDSTFLIMIKDGFAFYNRRQSKTKKDESPKPEIVKVKTTKRSYAISGEMNLELHFEESRHLSIEAYLPFGYNEQIFYSIENKLKRKGQLENGNLKLNNLNAGTYELTLYPFAKTSRGNHKKLKIRVLPPWYLSNLMLVFYLFFIVFVIKVYHRMLKLKMRRQRLREKKSLIIENMNKLEHMEKNNLKKEIEYRKKELNQTATTLIKKNETIILLRNELKRLLKVSPNKSRTNKLIDFSNNKKAAEMDWLIFERNFNELHEEFFSKLLASYPCLTKKDLKLCAFIKTGLCSKEIAQLMNITTRGVEIHRYRLRKKLNLETEVKLHNFLMLF
ncbi:LuxR C-terminal-related transcriptional regulator [Gaetbulibacter sp. M240]|uniref:helix-turn-helix and ligand-binding sensor domain-containing protein n=1 Tax=Gaetbulibacter sp. M240 TaxID=3126511 RepID=UPI00374E4BEB